MHDREEIRRLVATVGSSRGRSTTPRGRHAEKQPRAVVGSELTIERVEAKAKLSQNRNDADVAGVIAGLRREGAGREQEEARAMAALLASRPGQAPG